MDFSPLQKNVGRDRGAAVVVSLVFFGLSLYLATQVGSDWDGAGAKLFRYGAAVFFAGLGVVVVYMTATERRSARELEWVLTTTPSLIIAIRRTRRSYKTDYLDPFEAENHVSTLWIEAEDGRKWGYSNLGSEQAAIDLVLSLSPDAEVIDERPKPATRWRRWLRL